MNEVAKPKKEQKMPALKKSGPQGTYKYLVCPGNNSRLLLGIFRARPWWQTTKEDPDFVWEMYRNPKRYAASDTTGKVQADWCALNHFERDSCLVTKHGLYWSLRAHFDHLSLPLPEWLPETYHVTPPEADADVAASSSGDPTGSSSNSPEGPQVEWSRWLAAFHREAEAVAIEPQGCIFNSGGAAALWGDGDKEGGAEGAPTKEENPEKLPPIGRAHGATPDCVASPPIAAQYRRKKKKTREAADSVTNVWIAKPAALSNRGSGIKVISSIDQVEALLKSSKTSGKGRNRAGYIVQKYIERPLLVDGRKFDIRVFVLLVAHPRTGQLQSWFYEEGYLRTSSASYSLSAKSLKNALVHLTNDGIQNQDTTANGYGKYEEGNKLSYAQFQAYLDALHPDGSKQGWVRGAMVDDMQTALKEMVSAGCPISDSDSGTGGGGLNPKKRRNCFELLGCDFMVDDQYQLKLIEANSNPCLEFSSAHLEEFLPRLLEDTFQLSVDVLFPPPRQPQTKTAQAALSLLVEARKHNRFLPLYNEAAVPLGSASLPASSGRKSLSSNSRESRKSSSEGSSRNRKSSRSKDKTNSSSSRKSNSGSSSNRSSQSNTPVIATKVAAGTGTRAAEKPAKEIPVIASHVTTTQDNARSLLDGDNSSAAPRHHNSSADDARRTNAPRFTTKSKQHESNTNKGSQLNDSRESMRNATPTSIEMPAVDLEIDFDDI